MVIRVVGVLEEVTVRMRESLEVDARLVIRRDIARDGAHIAARDPEPPEAVAAVDHPLAAVRAEAHVGQKTAEFQRRGSSIKVMLVIIRGGAKLRKEGRRSKIPSGEATMVKARAAWQITPVIREAARPTGLHGSSRCSPSRHKDSVSPDLWSSGRASRQVLDPACSRTTPAAPQG